MNGKPYRADLQDAAEDKASIATAEAARIAKHRRQMTWKTGRFRIDLRPVRTPDPEA